jgi:hypothetical protein
MSKPTNTEEILYSLAESTKTISEVLKVLRETMEDHNLAALTHYSKTEEHNASLLREMGNYSKLSFFCIAIAGGAFGLKEIVGVILK